MGSGIFVNFIYDFFQNSSKIPQLFLPAHEFLEDSKIGEELLEPLNDRLVLNMTVMRAVQKRLPRRQEDVGLDYIPDNIPSLDTVQR
jgi:hypothetical protein